MLSIFSLLTLLVLCKLSIHSIFHLFSFQSWAVKNLFVLVNLKMLRSFQYFFNLKFYILNVYSIAKFKESICYWENLRLWVLWEVGDKKKQDKCFKVSFFIKTLNKIDRYQVVIITRQKLFALLYSSFSMKGRKILIK